MKPIIGGPDTPKSQVARATSGGVMSTKPLPYSKPQGPTEQMRRAPGLGGECMPCGSQGEHRTPVSESGSVGIGGSTRKSGSQR